MKIKNTQIVIFTLISINFIFINQVKSQYAIAGTHGSIFVDIIPDTLLNPTPSQMNANYYIDINQDGTDDIKINAHNQNTLGVALFYVEVSALDTFTSFTFGNTDSVMNDSTLCWYFAMLKKYNNGDTIKSANYITQGYLYYGVNQGNMGNYCTGSDATWLNQGDKFIGVKYKTSSDTTYGWVRVSVTNIYSVLIEEFSLGSPLSGINTLDVNNFISVYPNPASTIIYVALNMQNTLQCTALQITDLLGNVIKQENFTTAKTTIDVNDLQNGIYFMQVKTNEGVLTKKIIVQR